MKIALIGASGNIGSRILDEALRRGHIVTGIIRNTSRMELHSSIIEIVSSDLFNTDEVSRHFKGKDVIISAFSPGNKNPHALIEATKSLLTAAKNAGVKRVIAVGRAGCLEIAPGVRLMDTPAFPDSQKPIAKAHNLALQIYREEKDLDWTNISPPAEIKPGARTGNYRISENTIVHDSNGNSSISMEDFAVAVMDEVENPSHIKKRFTVGY
jgi:uncharacterized protein